MKKKLLSVFLAVVGSVSLFGLSACDGTLPNSEKEYTISNVYARAQEQGYSGSLEEFIALISGKDGKDGGNGKDGTDGKSAYIIWQEEGHEGTETEFLEWLKGERGKDGTDGKSAYIIWQEEGHEGTENDFLEWLAGESVCSHTYSEWEILLAASCTAGGAESRTCESCGYTEYRFSPANGHTAGGYANHYGLVDDTWHFAICSHCGVIYREEHLFQNAICTKCGNKESIAPVSNPHYYVVFDEVYHDSEGWSYRHKGVDFSAAVGDSVYAMLDGTVESISYNSEYGNLIVIDHGNGLKTTYRFVEPVAAFGVGQKLRRGEKIATISEACGREVNDGPHLHFEVSLNEKAQNPLDYFNAIYSEKVGQQ